MSDLHLRRLFEAGRPPDAPRKTLNKLYRFAELILQKYGNQGLVDMYDLPDTEGSLQYLLQRFKGPPLQPDDR